MTVSANDNETRLRTLRRKATHAPMLDADTERELIERVQGGCSQSLRGLIDAHMRIVFSTAEKFARNGVMLDDLVSEGTLGLVEAARRFDPERGNRFSTYAAWWVRAYVRRYAFSTRRMVPAPSTRNGRKILWSLRRVQKQIAQQTGRPATRDEVASALGVSPEEVAAVESALGGRDISLGAKEDRTTFELPAETPTPEDHAAESEARQINSERLAEALAQLSEREREIVRRRILDDDATSLAALGESLGVSRERVRQIQQRAQSKLRAALERQVA